MPTEFFRGDGGYIPPERQIEAGEARPDVLASWIERTAELIRSYKGLSQKEYDSLFEQLNSYEGYLLRHFVFQLQGRDFKSAAEKDEYLKVLIDEELSNYPKYFAKTQGAPKVGQEMLDAIALSLKERALAARGPEELCNSLGVIYEKQADVLVPTFGRKAKAVGLSEGFVTGEYKDKLGELLPFLIDQKLFGENILVSEGEVRDDQMREYPYMLVEIPALRKQILICNQLWEGVFVSQAWLGRDIFAQADKQELQERHGMQKVIYDSQGRWLQKVRDLLLQEPGEAKKPPEDFSEAFRDIHKPHLKDFAAVRRGLLRELPAPQDFLKNMRDLKPSDRASNKTFWRRAIKITSGKSLVNPTNREVIECAQIFYGEADPNLNYALKLEEKNKEYFGFVLKNGLPVGVDYFLSEPETNEPGETTKGGERFKGCPTDMEFVKRYLAQGYVAAELNKKLGPDLNFTVNTFVAIFRPDIHRKVRDEFIKLKHEGRNEHGSPNIFYSDFLRASLEVYPQSKELQYLLDLDEPHKLLQMIKGEYNLEGLAAINAIGRKGLVELKPQSFPTFEKFWEGVMIPNRNSANSIGTALTRMCGFGVDHLGTKLGAVGRPRNIDNLYQILLLIYPESRQLRYLIDREDKDKITAMIKGEYNLVGIASYGKNGKRELKPITCPTFAEFQQNYLKIRDPKRVVALISQGFGIGWRTFAQKLGITLAGENLRMGELLEGLKQIYPESQDEIQTTIQAIKSRKG